jgi:FdhE protein
MSVPDPLADLEARKPEWRPWLAVVGHALRETENRAWAAAVPDVADSRTAGMPLLGQASIRLDRALLEKLVASLESGAAGTAQAQAYTQRAAPTVFESALEGDHAGLLRLADELGVDAEAFAARAALVPVPFLHACMTRLTPRIPASWSEGYCPICGAWPAFAEVRGIERTRHLRCGRCGSGWQTSHLLCPYCATTDHDALQSLIVEESAPPSTIDVCNRCRGYVKAFSMLQATPGAAVMLRDLSTAELDFSAAQRGYHRPGGLGHRLNVTVHSQL